MNSLGTTTANTTYQDGLLNVISRNETDAIPKLEAWSMRLQDTEFTIPLWLSRYINDPEFLKILMLKLKFSKNLFLYLCIYVKNGM